VTVGRPYSAAENQTEAFVPISLTSATASMPESGTSRTLHLRDVYSRRVVYQHICGWHSFEPWLSRIESFDLLKLWEIVANVPPEWVEPEELAQLIDCIDARRSRVRELIAATRQSHQNPFGAWTEAKP
jgi:hypothetical protein